jgi:hypothetical protein
VPSDIVLKDPRTNCRAVLLGGLRICGDEKNKRRREQKKTLSESGVVCRTSSSFSAPSEVFFAANSPALSFCYFLLKQKVEYKRTCSNELSARQNHEPGSKDRRTKNHDLPHPLRKQRGRAVPTAHECPMTND